MVSPRLVFLPTRIREDGREELCPRFVGNGFTLAADDLFRAKLQLLCEAREAVDRELESLVQAPTVDKPVLRRVRDRISGLAEQTDSLLLAMVKLGAAQDLIGPAEELFDIFRDLEECVDAVVQGGPPMAAASRDRKERMSQLTLPRLVTPSPVLQGRRVLLVEDELLLFDEMREELEGEGAEVLGPAPSVADALSLLASEPRLDAAILDINLGGEMVYPVAEALKGRRIPFIFATGYGARVIPQAFDQVPLIEKPVRTPRLLEALRERVQAGR